MTYRDPKLFVVFMTIVICDFLFLQAIEAVKMDKPKSVRGKWDRPMTVPAKSDWNWILQSMEIKSSCEGNRKGLAKWIRSKVSTNTLESFNLFKPKQMKSMRNKCHEVNKKIVIKPIKNIYLQNYMYIYLFR